MIQYCDRCKIKCVDDVFHWNFRDTPTTAEKVLEKVCLSTENEGNKDKQCLANLLSKENND